MKSPTNIFLPLIWLTVGLVFAFFFPVEDDPFGFLTIVFSLVYLLFGVLLAVQIIWNLAKTKSKKDLLSLSTFVISIFVIVFSLDPVSNKGVEFRSERDFLRKLPVYEEIAAQAEKERKSATNENYRGINYSVEVNPHVLVAFPIRGILDNWEAVVYDPAGDVLEAKGITGDGEFTAPANLKKIFGGDLVSCRPIERNYYRCWFT